MREKRKSVKKDDPHDKLLKICEKEGVKSWNLVKETLLIEETEVDQLRKMIEYLMTIYKPDYFRPALLSLCCKAIGGDSKKTIHTGAALTLLGWGIGIHDDIIDQSIMKGGHPTILDKFGRDMALVLSDVLLFKGFTLLGKMSQCGVSIGLMKQIFTIIEKIWFEQSEGEIKEIQSRKTLNITPHECLRKIHMRASELEAIARIGGIIGNSSKDNIKILGEFGRLLGKMSILKNEIIDMLQLDVLKHRIRKESLPLPIIYSLQNPKIRSKLINKIQDPNLSKATLKQISKITDDSDGIQYVSDLIDEMAASAYTRVKYLKNKELELFIEVLPIRKSEWKLLLD